MKAAGHTVYIEKGAGVGANISDEIFLSAGAVLLDSHAEVFALSDMIFKVKEPLPEEYEFFREGQILFAYLHLAADKALACMLMEKGVTGVAFETVQLSDGHLPLLEPMSEVAGRLAVQEGAKYLEKTYGGRGVLLSGIPGVARVGGEHSRVGIGCRATSYA